MQFEPTDFGPGYKPTSADSIPPVCTATSCDVVVHVRRGDISGTQKQIDGPMYVSDSQWLSMLDQVAADVKGVAYVAKVHPEQTAGVLPTLNSNGGASLECGDTVEAMKAAPIRFHIYSEGTAENFARFTDWAAENGVAMRFHLNGDLRTAFHAMVVADVFVHGPSSLSGLAGQFSISKQFALGRTVHGRGAVTVYPARGLAASGRAVPAPVVVATPAPTAMMPAFEGSSHTASAGLAFTQPAAVASSVSQPAGYSPAVNMGQAIPVNSDDQVPVGYFRASDPVDHNAFVAATVAPVDPPAAWKKSVQDASLYTDFEAPPSAPPSGEEDRGAMDHMVQSALDRTAYARLAVSNQYAADLNSDEKVSAGSVKPWHPFAWKNIDGLDTDDISATAE